MVGIMPGAMAFTAPLRVIRPPGPVVLPHGPLGPVIRVVPPPALPPVPSLPVLALRAGNMFPDTHNAAMRWGLPNFVLTADTDPAFLFAASQTGQQADGTPFDKVRLVLGLTAAEPAPPGPAIHLQPIALQQMAATLSSAYTDQNGAAQKRVFNATTIQALPGGAWLLSFDGTILGDAVPALYQDLRVFGAAILTLNASFQAWVTRTIMRPPLAHPMPMPMPIPMPPRPGVRPATIAVPIHPSPVMTLPTRIVTSFGAPQSWSQTIPIALKYKADCYQMRYTVSRAAGQSSVITDARQLRDFNGVQSGYAPFTALGDIGAKYPSLGAAYIGVLSHEIVIIPRRYAILRGVNGCAANCVAEVDSAASTANACVFEFDFTLAPDVSRVEMQALQLEIAAHPDLKAYQLTFPNALRDTPASTLLTAFQNSARFAAGALPHSFALTVTIRDGAGNRPAVADANLFILRMCSQSGADVIGSLSLKLDDGFTDPVLSAIDLNFQRTVGTDEIVVAAGTDPDGVLITNQSPLDLAAPGYALLKNAALTEVAAALILPAGKAVPVTLPSAQEGAQIIIDSEILLPKPFTMAFATKCLNFTTVDVQQTQYLVGIDGSGIDYARVASVAVEFSFAALANLAVPPLKLSKDVQADSTHMLVPLANAVFSLPGVVHLTVAFIDAAAPACAFMLENDFAAQPVLHLLQADIDAHAPAPSAAPASSPAPPSAPAPAPDLATVSSPPPAVVPASASASAPAAASGPSPSPAPAPAAATPASQ